MFHRKVQCLYVLLLIKQMDTLENMKIEKQIIFDRVRYLMLKSDISDVYFHKYTEIQMNLGDDLPLEKNIKRAKCSNTY